MKKEFEKKYIEKLISLKILSSTVRVLGSDGIVPIPIPNSVSTGPETGRDQPLRDGFGTGPIFLGWV
jgi:hypothetical protein